MDRREFVAASAAVVVGAPVASASPSLPLEDRTRLTDQELTRLACERMGLELWLRPILSVFPIAPAPLGKTEVSWEILHRGDPERPMIGLKCFTQSLEMYGEYMHVEFRKKSVESLRDRMCHAVSVLVNNRYNRIEHSSYQCLMVDSAHRFYCDWSNDGRDPLDTFRQVLQVSQRHGGYANFNGTASAFLNSETLKPVLKRLGMCGKHWDSLPEFKRRSIIKRELKNLTLRHKIPHLRVSDNGVVGNDGKFMPFAPNGAIIVAGRRPDNLWSGEYVVLREEKHPASFSHTHAVDSSDGKGVDVHDGHSGLAVLYRPEEVVIVDTCAQSIDPAKKFSWS